MVSSAWLAAACSDDARDFSDFSSEAREILDDWVEGNLRLLLQTCRRVSRGFAARSCCLTAQGLRAAQLLARQEFDVRRSPRCGGRAEVDQLDVHNYFSRPVATPCVPALRLRWLQTAPAATPPRGAVATAELRVLPYARYCSEQLLAVQPRAEVRMRRYLSADGAARASAPTLEAAVLVPELLSHLTVQEDFLFAKRILACYVSELERLRTAPAATDVGEPAPTLEKFLQHFSTAPVPASTVPVFLAAFAHFASELVRGDCLRAAPLTLHFLMALCHNPNVALHDQVHAAAEIVFLFLFCDAPAALATHSADDAPGDAPSDTMSDATSDALAQAQFVIFVKELAAEALRSLLQLTQSAELAGAAEFVVAETLRREALPVAAVLGAVLGAAAVSAQCAAALCAPRAAALLAALAPSVTPAARALRQHLADLLLRVSAPASYI